MTAPFLMVTLLGLEPGADQAAGGAYEAECVGAVVEVTGVELGGAEVFEVVEGG